MNDRFEEELQAAMRSVEVPPGFAASVLQRIEAEKVAHRFAMTFPAPARRWTAGLLAACLLAGTVTAFGWKRHRKHEAEQQFALAIAATSHALQQTREQLSRAGLRLAN